MIQHVQKTFQYQESEAASKQSDIGHFFFPWEGKRQAIKVSKGTCIQLSPPGQLVQMGIENSRDGFLSGPRVEEAESRVAIERASSAD
jgi:hypothetical protein